MKLSTSWALLSLFAGLLPASRASAVAPVTEGLYRTGGVLAQPAPNASAVLRGTRHEWAVLGARIAPTRTVLWAEDNQNSRFQLMVGFGAGPCAETALVLGGTVYLSEGYGSDGRGCDASFLFDASVAAAAARVLGVPRQDRSPVAERVAGSFAYDAHASEVVLTLRNPAGAPAVLRRQGGRNRGPRDNQFAFVITRDGARVQELQGMDLGGLSYMAPLAPGGSAELRAPLAAWGHVSERGRYVVECTYETEFAPEGADTNSDMQRGRVWDRTFTGRVEFTVR